MIPNILFAFIAEILCCTTIINTSLYFVRLNPFNRFLSSLIQFSYQDLVSIQIPSLYIISIRSLFWRACLIQAVSSYYQKIGSFKIYCIIHYLSSLTMSSTTSLCNYQITYLTPLHFIYRQVFYKLYSIFWFFSKKR